jgi:hypothetical protein
MSRHYSRYEKGNKYVLLVGKTEETGLFEVFKCRFEYGIKFNMKEMMVACTG